MLKITAIGNLTNEVELKMNETTRKPYAILRIASDRRYKDQAGNKLTDFISIKVPQPPGGALRRLRLEGLQAGRLRGFRDHHLRGRAGASARFPDQGHGGGVPLSPPGGASCREQGG